MGSLQFVHPEPPGKSSRIWPVFLSFAGCPHRCVFCAQDRQTGHAERSVNSIAENLDKELNEALAAGRGPYELAFYGGTFTGLPTPAIERFLTLAAHYRERGLVEAVRCSTRPDSVSPALLSELREAGMDTVELGIQSFDDEALSVSGRGYGQRDAINGCNTVRDAGLRLGIQLLPGLPGDRPGMFQNDVRMALSFAPETARLYPCVVIKGTPLDSKYMNGRFKPWSLGRAVEELAEAVLAFWKADVRIIRLGLAPEDSLMKNLRAGPWHPAFGQSVRGRALLSYIKEELGGYEGSVNELTVPRRYQGELFGHANELINDYERLGVDKASVRYWNNPYFQVS